MADISRNKIKILALVCLGFSMSQKISFVMLALIVISLVAGAQVVDQPSLPTSAASLPLLEKALEEERRNVESVESDVVKLLEEIHSTSFRKLTAEVALQTLAAQESRVEVLRNKKQEQLLRLRFLSTLLEKVKQLNQENPSLQTFRIALLKMSVVDFIGSLETETSSKLWRFNANLSIALGDLLEPFEDPAAFILDYLSWSTISQPRNPTEYITEARNYRGGHALELTPQEVKVQEEPKIIEPSGTAPIIESPHLSDEGYDR